MSNREPTRTLPELERAFANVDPAKKLFVLSDYDYTLCHSYSFNPGTNDHMPHIEPGVIEAGSKTHLVVATGRRAHSGALTGLWDDGIVSQEQPIITENGGVFIFRKNGKTKFLDMVPPYAINHIASVKEQIEKAYFDIPEDKELVLKLGRTMLIARLQGEDGETTADDQTWLRDTINGLLPTLDLKTVDNRVSIALQYHAVNKAIAFRRYLQMRKIKRSDITVVGIGDGENDQEIFMESDITIGLSPIVKSLVQVELPGSSRSIESALNHVANFQA